MSSDRPIDERRAQFLAERKAREKAAHPAQPVNKANGDQASSDSIPVRRTKGPEKAGQPARRAPANPNTNSSKTTPNPQAGGLDRRGSSSNGSTSLVSSDKKQPNTGDSSQPLVSPVTRRGSNNVQKSKQAEPVPLLEPSLVVKSRKSKPAEANESKRVLPLQKCLGLNTFTFLPTRPSPSLSNLPPEGGAADTVRLAETVRTVTSKFDQIRLIGEQHGRLCDYVDLVRVDRNRFVVVEESYERCLEDLIMDEADLNRGRILVSTFELFHAVSYLHQHGVVHRNLDLRSVRLDEYGHIKLKDYGLYSMSDHGSLVPFVVGHPRYMSPEVVIGGPDASLSFPMSEKADVWALGLILNQVVRRSAPAIWAKDLSKSIPEYFTELSRLLQKKVMLRHSQKTPKNIPSTSNEAKQGDTPANQPTSTSGDENDGKGATVASSVSGSGAASASNGVPKEQVLSSDTPFFQSSGLSKKKSVSFQDNPTGQHEWCRYCRDPTTKYEHPHEIKRKQQKAGSLLGYQSAPENHAKSGNTLPISNICLECWLNPDNLSDEDASPALKDLLRSCLEIDPLKRAHLDTLTSHRFFWPVLKVMTNELTAGRDVWEQANSLSSAVLSLDSATASTRRSSTIARTSEVLQEVRAAVESKTDVFLPRVPLLAPFGMAQYQSPMQLTEGDPRLWSARELYYLWLVNGGSVESELARNDRLNVSPPVRRIPQLVHVDTAPSLVAPESVIAGPDGEVVDDDVSSVTSETTTTRIVRMESDAMDLLESRYNRECVPVRLDAILSVIREESADIRASLLKNEQPSAWPSSVLREPELGALSKGKTVSVDLEDRHRRNKSDGKDHNLQSRGTEEKVNKGETATDDEKKKKKKLKGDIDNDEDDDTSSGVPVKEAEVRLKAMKVFLKSATDYLLRTNIRIIQLYRSLLGHFPATKDDIVALARDTCMSFKVRTSVAEASVSSNGGGFDPSVTFSKSFVPPFPAVMRRQLWPALLDVYGDVDLEFRRCVNEKPTEADSQLDRDLPRCHQYHSFMGTAEGRRKLRRVLKAWLNVDSKRKYWQGLDSVASPFVVLFFDNEPMAFACLERLVDVYLSEFFVQEGSDFLNIRMQQLIKLVNYHDPELAMHLDSIKFNPELYAVPWFFTLFSHIFPLERIFVLWDVLLLMPPSFILFIALAILISLREKLLSLDFNGCILFFSHLAVIDVEDALQVALVRFQDTPSSFFSDEANEEEEFEFDIEDYMNESRTSRVTEAARPRDAILDTMLIPPSLSVQDLANRSEGVTVLDVRPSSEFEKSCWPRSISVPFLEEVEDASDEAAVNKALKEWIAFVEARNIPSGDWVVVIGNSEAEESRFARALVSSGFHHICILKDSYTALLKSPSAKKVLLSHAVKE